MAVIKVTGEQRELLLRAFDGLAYHATIAEARERMSAFDAVAKHWAWDSLKNDPKRLKKLHKKPFSIELTDAEAEMVAETLRVLFGGGAAGETVRKLIPVAAELERAFPKLELDPAGSDPEEPENETEEERVEERGDRTS